MSPDEQDALRQICLAANGELVDDPMGLLESLADGGQAAPTEMLALAEVGWAAMFSPDGNIWDELATLKPECDKLDIPAVAAAAETSAAVEIRLIDRLYLTGRTEGCPLDEILAGEYWIGPNGEQWLDEDGNEWSVALSVDASGDDLRWSFSVESFSEETGSHRLISYSESPYEPPLDVKDEPGVVVYTTIFTDSVASVSGGWSDTSGFVNIACE